MSHHKYLKDLLVMMGTNRLLAYAYGGLQRKFSESASKARCNALGSNMLPSSTADAFAKAAAPSSADRRALTPWSCVRNVTIGARVEADGTAGAGNGPRKFTVEMSAAVAARRDSCKRIQLTQGFSEQVRYL